MIYSIIFLTFFFYGPSAFSEYRVYQYLVKNKNLNDADKTLDNKSYFTTSSFDPATYLSYHGGSDSMKIELLKTWVCKGSTANRDTFCDGPAPALTENKNNSEAQ